MIDVDPIRAVIRARAEVAVDKVLPLFLRAPAFGTITAIVGREGIQSAIVDMICAVLLEGQPIEEVLEPIAALVDLDDVSLDDLTPVSEDPTPVSEDSPRPPWEAE